MKTALKIAEEVKSRVRREAGRCGCKISKLAGAALRRMIEAEQPSAAASFQCAWLRERIVQAQKRQRCEASVVGPQLSCSAFAGCESDL